MEVNESICGNGLARDRGKIKKYHKCYKYLDLLKINLGKINKSIFKNAYMFFYQNMFINKYMVHIK